jgi:arsenite-transporting ATPase
MTTILIFTGSAGPGIALAAAATALHTAKHGSTTLLLSLGTPQALGALLGTPVAAEPASITPHLHVAAIDPLAELSAAWERGRGRMPAQLAQVAGDELPLLPGMDMLFGMLRLEQLAPHYGQVVLDAGPHDALLRALALPDGLRWGVRLLFGLDRGPGRSAASVARAALPTSFLPTDAMNGAQDLRVEAERIRARLAGQGAAVRYVLRPDKQALEEARLASPALQLHGLAVPAIAAGPLLPGTVFAARQDALLAEVAATWPGRALLRFDQPPDVDQAALAEVGAQLDGVGAKPAADAPIAEAWGGTPALAIELPGLPQGALGLTLSGDELIVRVGPYRRHILLPEGLRGTTAIRATREGERLIVRRRNP